jgi:hypothetical protein
MTLRTFIDKNGNSWEWEETPEVVEAVKNLTQFAGNYPRPLYAPHPDLNNETQNDTKTTNVG